MKKSNKNISLTSVAIATVVVLFRSCSDVNTNKYKKESNESSISIGFMEPKKTLKIEKNKKICNN